MQQFTWDEKEISHLLSLTRYKQGLLNGFMENLGFETISEATLQTLTADVIKSTEIEGKILNHDQVRSSIARKLGMNIGGLVAADRDVEGIVEVMVDATRNYNKPLSKERLFAWLIFLRRYFRNCHWVQKLPADYPFLSIVYKQRNNKIVAAATLLH